MPTSEITVNGSGIIANIAQGAATLLVGVYAWATRNGRDAVRIDHLEEAQKLTSIDIKEMAKEQKETNALLHEVVGELKVIAKGKV